ncbi:MAG: sialate O-acetylesterase [Verrucomicrobia bacterium]|nr:sialate O-acetylesterase [Verrucomicrobiota bacterium]
MNPLLKHQAILTRRHFLRCGALGLGTAAIGIAARESIAAEAKKKAGRVETPPPTHPPLQPADIAKLPEGMERLDLFLLIGQSNMKGRGVMPDEPKRDPRLVMMHLKDDAWYLARHPLHLTGDAKTFAGHDNAGVGSGMAFAEAVAAREPTLRVGLIPCAVGGSQIALWQKGAKLYDEALRRAKLALRQTAPVKARIRAALWLQGEADATDDRLKVYEAKLLKLVDDLRADLGSPDLPFIACTIGEMRDNEGAAGRAKMNELLLSLPSKRPHTACVDARDLKGNIGDNVHFDTAAQNEIGRWYAEKYFALTK